MTSRIKTFKSRASVFLTGVVVLIYGLVKYQQHGAFPYLNWQSQPLFPLGVVGIGVVISTLACLPERWVSKWSATQPAPKREAHVLHYLDEHRHQHVDPRHLR